MHATPIGAISVGSNDIHLLVAASDGASSFEVLYDESVLAELVASIDGGAFPDAALDKAMDEMERLAAAARAARASHVIVVATEAMREVSNGSAFMARVAHELGVEAALISGEEEAALDYCWATFGEKPHHPLLVVDSGGGSTQVVLCDKQRPEVATSLPIGAGNMTQRFLAHDPPRVHEVEALETYVKTLIAALPAHPSPHSAIFMGGSADHLLRMAAAPEHAVVMLHDLAHALDALQQSSAKEIAHRHGDTEPRVRLLAAGAAILSHLLTHYGLDEARVKKNGIRGGVIVCYARRGEDWRQDLAAHTAHTWLPPAITMSDQGPRP